MAIDIGTLAVSMGMDIAELRKKSDVAEKRINSMAKAMERDFEKVNKAVSEMQKKFDNETRQMKADIRSLESQMEKMSRSTEKHMDKTSKSLKSTSTAFNGFIKTVRAAALGYATVLATMEITQFTSGILKQGVALDSLQRSYKAITGSMEESNRILNMLGKTADDLGLNLNAMESSYRNILAASKNTALEGQAIEKVFMSVIKASAVLGMSADDTAGTLRALSQMISKGNVQAEELRGQLGERLPGAFQMAAEAMGVSTQKLNDMLERGEVLATDLLPKLADVLEKRFGEAAKDAGDRAGASFERLSNSMIQLQRTLASSGILEFFVDLSNEISTTLNDSQDDIRAFVSAFDFDELIRKSKGVITAIEGIASSINLLIDIFNYTTGGPLQDGIIVGLLGLANPKIAVLYGLAQLLPKIADTIEGYMAAWRGDIDWGDFFGSTEDFYDAMDAWKEGERTLKQYKKTMQDVFESGADYTDTAGLGVIKWSENLSKALGKNSNDLKATQSDIEAFSKAFDKPKEVIVLLQNEIEELEHKISTGVFGNVHIVTPELSNQLSKIKELKSEIQTLQEVVDYNYEVETLKRLGDAFGYIQEKTNAAVKAQKEFQEMLETSPYDPNMGEFADDSKTRDAALKAYQSQKDMLDDFVNYSESKYDEERENVNEAFRQLYIIYKDDAEVREQLREALSKRLKEIDEEQTQAEKAEWAKRIDMTRSSFNEMYDAFEKFNKDMQDAQKDIEDYTDSALLSDYDLAVKKATAEYKEMLDNAKKYSLDFDKDKRAIDAAYQKHLADIWEDETKRRKEEYEKQLKAKQEANQKLYAIDIELANHVADDSWLIFDRGLQKALEQHEETQTRMTEAEWDEIQKRKEEQEKLEEKARKEYEREWKRVYDDMHDFAADTFYDLFKDTENFWGNLLDTMEDMFIRSLANMAAEAAMTNIFKPIMNQMAGTALGGLLGLPSTQIGSTSSSLLSGLSNLSGMGWLNSTIPGTASIGAELGWGAAAAQEVGTIASTGTTWGGAIATAAPWAAMAAVAIPIVMNLLEDEPDPRIGLFAGTGTAGDPNLRLSQAGYFYSANVQDISASASDPIIQYYDSVFAALDDITNQSINDLLNASDYGQYAAISWFDPSGMDTQQVIDKMMEDLFVALREGLVSDIGLNMDTGIFDESFFEGIKVEGETLLDTYARFRGVIENTDDFVEDFSRRIDDLGLSAEEAYQQIETVTVVMAEMDAAVGTLTSGTATNQLNAMVDTWNAYIDVMAEAQATAEQLTEAESNRNLVVGSQITGLNVNSIAQALGSGQDISEVVGQAINQLVNEQIASEMFDEMSPVVEEAGRIWSETGGDIDAVSAYLKEAGYYFDDLSDSIEDLTQSVEYLADEADLTIRLLEAMGDTESAIAMQREQEISDLEDAYGDAASALVSLLDSIYEWEDWLGKVEAAQDAVNDAESAYEQAKSDYLAGLKAELAILEDNLANAKNNYISLLKEELAILEDNLAFAKDNYISLLEEEYGALEDNLSDAEAVIYDLIDSEEALIDARRAAAKDIEDFINDLMGSDRAPVQSMDYFEQRYAELLQAAQTAAPEDAGQAVADLTAFTGEYLDFAGAYGGNYNDLFEMITGDLSDLGVTLSDISDDETDKLDDIKEALGITNEEVVSIDEALQNYIDAVEALEQGQWMADELDSLQATEGWIEDLYLAQEAYYLAKEELDNNWYEEELDSLRATEGWIEDLYLAQEAYYGAKQELDNNWYEEEITAIEGVGKSIDELRDDWLQAAANLEEASNNLADIEGNPPPTIEPPPTEDPTSYAEDFVERLYSLIGREGIGDAPSQIDQEGYDYWIDQAFDLGPTGYDELAKMFADSVIDHLETIDNEIEQYVADYIGGNDIYSIFGIPPTGTGDGGTTPTTPEPTTPATGTGDGGTTPTTPEPTTPDPGPTSPTRSIDDYVLDLYASVGRGPSIGTEVSQIDQAGYDYWYNMLSAAGISNYPDVQDSFQQAVNDYIANYDDPLADYVEANKQFRYGGIIDGPMSGYQMPGATFHGSEAIIPLNNGYVPVQIQSNSSDDMKDVKNLLEAILSKGDGNNTFVIQIGPHQIEDFTVKVLETNPEAHKQIRRVSHA